MDKKNKMALLMVMTNRPIVFTMGSIFHLSIETFSKVRRVLMCLRIFLTENYLFILQLLKSIYSAYNMLSKVM